ncbi:MAG: c-type cytochrome, partial [Hylemonella sp.]
MLFPCPRLLLAGLLSALALGPPPAAAQQPQQLQLCVACHGPHGHSTHPMVPALAGQPRPCRGNQLVLIRDG